MGGCKWPHCLTIGFLLFFGLLLNSQNNLFSWVANPDATLHFNPNGGAWADGSCDVIDIVKPYGALVESSVLSKLTKVGFEFLGWFDHSGNKFKFPIQMPEGETTLVAKWGYAVTFQDKDEKVVLTEKVESGKNAIDPEEYGIVVMGEGKFWSKDGRNAFDFSKTTIGENLTLKATGNIGYVVTFDSAEGIWAGDTTSKTREQAVVSGGMATEPTAPEKAGYVFVSWLKNGTEFDFNTAITGPITLTAKWIEAERFVVHLNFSKVFTGNMDIAEAFLAAGKTDEYAGDKIKAFFEKNFQLYEVLSDGTKKDLSISTDGITAADVFYDSDKIENYEQYISVELSGESFTISIKLKIPNGCNAIWNSVNQDYDIVPKTYTIKELAPKDNIYKVPESAVTFVPITE